MDANNKTSRKVINQIKEQVKGFNFPAMFSINAAREKDVKQKFSQLTKKDKSNFYPNKMQLISEAQLQSFSEISEVPKQAATKK